MLELFQKGGVLMYPILFCSILALVVVSLLQSPPDRARADAF